MVGLLVQMNKDRSNGHRDRFDIIADVLREAAVGVRKTHLMYRCNLSFKQLETYLKFLVDTGLLKTVMKKESSKTFLFETTEKGQAFLRTYRNLKTLLSV